MADVDTITSTDTDESTGTQFFTTATEFTELVGEPYIGKILSKPRPLTGDNEYLECVIWCNANNATIEDKETYYEIVAIPETPLEEIKERKIQSFQSRRDQEEAKNITVEGLGTFEVDSVSQERLRNAIALLTDDTTTRTWTTADGIVLTVNRVQLTSILAACGTRSDEMYAKYIRLKNKVNACTTKEEVEAIYWDDED